MKLSERIRMSMDDAEAGLTISWPIDEWADEVELLEDELKYWKDAHSVLSEVTYNRNAALKRENKELEEAIEYARKAILADTQESE